MNKVTITFHDDCWKVLPYLTQMREGGFPFLRTDRASRALHNGLYGWGSRRAIADLDWDWNVRFKANPNGQNIGISQQRRQKVEVALMVRDSDIVMLRLMLDGLDFTIHDEPFHQQKEMRRRPNVFQTDWGFGSMKLPDIIW